MPKPVLISGIQPSGKLHIGNYLGALKNFVELQNSGKYRCLFFVADLHALTENPTSAELKKNTEDLVLSFLAAGIDPKKSLVFTQSEIPLQTELGWMLGALAPEGEMRRMTQYKEKSQSQTLSNIGLLTYPALMAADILIYDPKFVPVGEDQLQHLELARTLARKFNSRFGKTFIEPQPLLTKTPRVMSLDDPTKKMSKSRPQGCLFLDDSPAVIRQKIMRAVTDSGNEIKYAPETKPAISNLLSIYSAMGGESIANIEKKFTGKGYAEFKQDLAEVIIKTLAPFQKKKKELTKNYSDILKNIRIGNKKANAIASKKITEVKKKIGLPVI